jgi:serine/threonine-protein kinase
MSVCAGQVVGDTVLVRKIREGGMGSIWLADDRKLQRKVAVKLLSKERLSSQEATDRFFLEASIVSRVKNAHVPEVFDYGFTADRTPYLVLTLLEGADLNHWLAESGPLSLRETAALVGQVSSALSAAHSLGVIHRDVTASNIIMTPRRDGTSGDFHAYLIDFGIAKWKQTDKAPMLTHPGMTVGTPSYMSPEQLMGSRELDERTDVWSLAIVAYLCLTGRLPFSGASFRELCLAIYSGSYDAPSHVRDGIPREVDVWFETALAGEPAERFSSVAVMSEAFKLATGQLDRAKASWRAGSSLSRSETSPVGGRRISQFRERIWARRATLSCAVGGAAIGAMAAYFIASSANARAQAHSRGLEAPIAPAGSDASAVARGSL